MATVGTAHIEIDEQGTARIAGTTTKVVLIAEDYKHRGWSPDEIHEQYPYLSLAQIHAAFSYYYDHQAELDAEVERRAKHIEAMAAASEETPEYQKLCARINSYRAGQNQ